MFVACAFQCIDVKRSDEFHGLICHALLLEGNGAAALDYNGDRSLNDMVQFINNHCDSDVRSATGPQDCCDASTSAFVWFLSVISVSYRWKPPKPILH